LTKELEKKGHEINRKSMTSGIHLIYKDNKEKLHGIADQRREGSAFGL
jgi:gamma-glutamyltranspeptidase